MVLEKKMNHLTSNSIKNGVQVFQESAENWTFLVWNRNLCPKVLVPQRVNEHIFPTTVAKAKGLKAAGCHKRSAQDGKENVGRMTLVQQSSSNRNHLTTATKASERTRAVNSAGTIGGAKVNPDGITALIQKLCTLEEAAKGTVQAQTFTKRRGLQKSGAEKVFAPKVSCSLLVIHFYSLSKFVKIHINIDSFCSFFC